MTFVLCSLLLVCAAPRFLAAAPETVDKLQEQLSDLHSKLDNYQSELKQTERERREKQKALSRVKEKEHSILSLLERYNREIRRRRERFKELQSEERQANRSLDQISDKLTAVRRELDKRREMLKRRLREIYKQGEIMHGQILLGAQSLSDFMTRLRYFQFIVQQDRRIIETFRENRRRLQNLIDRKRDSLSFVKRKRREAQQALDEYRKIQKTRKQDLQELRKSKAFQKRRLQELEEQQDKLQSVVASLHKKRKLTRAELKLRSHPFGQKKGILPWPVEGQDVLRPFGTWKEDGIVHSNDGIDIAVKEGERVRVISDGKVLYARSYRGMGKVIIVRHQGKYLTLYGSLIRVQVKEGQTVNSGEVLGRAGQTPGMDQPRLYLQIFKGKTVLNPLNWLK